MSMIFCPLYSGSSGNALYVSYGATSLLIDAGKPGKTIIDAMKSIGADPASLSGILITHEHSDHISGAGVMSRRFDLPIYATAGTWQVMDDKIGAIAPKNRVIIERLSDFYLGQIGVVPFPIPHDANDPVGYRLYGGGCSISTATDLGHFTKDVRNQIAGSSLVLLESNHDPDMLMRNAHYSSWLKKRILGNKGHLSNDSCAQALLQLVDTGVHNVILGHLSGENNTPELALRTSEHAARQEGIRLGDELCLDLAYRDRVGSVYCLEDR